MQIKIGENHRVITDPLNYILQEKYIAKEGKNRGNEVWKNISYHSNLKQAIESYVGKGLKLSDAKGVEEILNKLEQIEEDIKSIGV